MSRPRSRPLDDSPVVLEVRAIRAKLLAQAGGTIEGYFRLMDELARKREAKAEAKRGSRPATGPAKRRTADTRKRRAA